MIFKIAVLVFFLTMGEVFLILGKLSQSDGIKIEKKYGKKFSRLQSTLANVALILLLAPLFIWHAEIVQYLNAIYSWPEGLNLVQVFAVACAPAWLCFFILHVIRRFVCARAEKASLAN